MESSQSFKITDKICLNYELLQTEIWNMNPEIFLKVLFIYYLYWAVSPAGVLKKKKNHTLISYNNTLVVEM